MATREEQEAAARALLNGMGFSFPTTSTPPPTGGGGSSSTPPASGGFRGLWAANTVYVVPDLVVVRGKLAFVSTPHTSGVEPDDGKFTKIAARASL